VDITNLRLTNEKHGIVAGDRVLKVAADILKSDSGLVVSRYGGDIFMCFSAGIIDRKEFDDYLNRICSDISEIYRKLPEYEGNHVCIGGVLSVEVNRDFQTLLIAADKALFFMKQLRQDGCYLYRRADRAREENKNLSKPDLEQLIKGIEQENFYNGTYTVDYPEFIRIYHFIRNICTRNKQQMQLVLITVVPQEDKNPTVEDRDQAMKFLETAINSTLRKVDITLRFSSTQCIVILNNTDAEHIRLVVERIMSSFYRLYDKKNMSLTYDVADINLPK
jgi:diguanylate cyclase (GGDEF)-like protein